MFHLYNQLSVPFGAICGENLILYLRVFACEN